MIFRFFLVVSLLVIATHLHNAGAQVTFHEILLIAFISLWLSK